MLHEALSQEGAEAMVDWMQNVETQRLELRELNDLSFARIDARFAQARAEYREELLASFGAFRGEFGTLRGEFESLRSDFAALRGDFGELRRDFATARNEVGLFREDMHVGLSRLETRLERRISDLMKWSFVFWVGSTVTLVVALAAIGRFR